MLPAALPVPAGEGSDASVRCYGTNGGAVAMALAEALHHSSGLKVMERAQHAALRGQATGTRAGVAGPAPVTEYVASALAVALSVPSQQLRPAYTAATFATGVNLDVTGILYPQFSSTAVEGSASLVVGSLPPGEVSVATDVNLDVTGMVYPHFSSTAVEGSASQVVGSLPLGEVFAAPLFNQVHQEQLAGGEIPENWVENPVVQKQVIVQASPHLPPVAEFTSAGDTAENSAIFPVVQEQVFVGVRPEPLAEPRDWFIPGLEALCPDDDGAPSLSLPSLADRAAEVVDSSSLRFLTASLEARRKEEEERRKDEVEKAKENEKQKAATAKELVVVPGVGKWVELVDSDTGRTYFWNPQTNATRWSLPGSSSSSSTPKRKKKKRRRKPRPRRRTARTR